MQIDKGAFLENLGGPEAAGKLDREAKPTLSKTSWQFS